MHSKRTCTCCGKHLTTRHKIKYCSVKCQKEKEYLDYVLAWKKGLETGNIGINAKNISSHLKKYLFRKYNESCCLCGWNKRNPITGKVPVEIDHIDGDFENNQERNLRLICPNCHALTTNFKNLNRGKGRKWRKDRYKKSLQI